MAVIEQRPGSSDGTSTYRAVNACLLFLPMLQGKRVYTDLSWAIGFAPRWLAAEIERQGIGYDRVLFASDEPWGDHPGESTRLRAAFGDGELARHAFQTTFDKLYG